MFFSPFSIVITCSSLGEERANLSAFRTFVRFVLVGVWEGLQFVMGRSLDFSLTFFFFFFFFFFFASFFLIAWQLVGPRMKWRSPLRSGFRKLVPDFQRLWSGPMCSCLWFTCSLASDRHCALWFVSSCLILISFSFCTSVRLCLVIVIFPSFFTYSFVYCLSWCVCLCFWCHWQAIFCNIGNL